MEIKIVSPVRGRCSRILVKEGDVVGPYDDLLVLTTEGPKDDDDVDDV